MTSTAELARSDESAAVLVISHDVIGSRMAGPGIRYWELAHVLARHFHVILAAPGAVDVQASELELHPYDLNDPQSLDDAVRRARCILLCGDVLDRFPVVQERDVPLIIDGYDPHTLETLAMFSGAPDQDARHRRREQILELQCRVGDFYICASERQRDWWLGLLEAAGRINVHTFGADPALRQLVDVVPFGLRSEPVRHTRQVLKGVWPGVGCADKVILWGGGLWEWLDPITAIRAMARIQELRPGVRMVFPGTRHPNHAAIPLMPVVQRAAQVAGGFGLVGRCVFFGDWVPYEEWPDYLCESDVAISLHLDTVETRLAFRSRVLDYIWAGLPMVLTTGDATSELIQRYGLGETVGYEDVEMVSQALLRLLDSPPEAFASAFDQARQALTWERAAGPLVAFCRNPQKAADRAAGYRLRQDSGALRELLGTTSSGHANRGLGRFGKWIRLFGDRG